MKYNQLFITDKNEIENIISASNQIIYSSVIVYVNEYITDSCKLPEIAIEVPVNIQNREDTNNSMCYCLPFLYNCFYHHKIPIYVEEKNIVKKESHELMSNLLLILHNLSIEALIMIAKYHNLYYKNKIFERVLEKENIVLKQHFTVINWVYDHICSYIYKQQYTL